MHFLGNQAEKRYVKFSVNFIRRKFIKFKIKFKKSLTIHRFFFFFEKPANTPFEIP